MDLILHADLSGLLGLCTFRLGDSQDVEGMFATCRVDATGYTWKIYDKMHRSNGPACDQINVSRNGRIYTRIQDWIKYNHLHRDDGFAQVRICITPSQKRYECEYRWYVNGQWAGTACVSYDAP